MYMITLYNYNCSPIFDGTISFFTKDIENFQKHWFALDDDEERHKRFLRSKSGEMVTDYYSNNPELNIVQHDKAKIYAQKIEFVEDREFYATNTYGFTEKYHVDKMIIRFLWIEFKGKFYRIARYRIKGVCMYDNFLDRNIAVKCYGNPVLINGIKFNPKYRFKQDIDVVEPPNYSYDKFSGNTLSTICYLTNGMFKTRKQLLKDSRHFRVTEEVLDHLFADVIGESG